MLIDFDGSSFDLNAFQVGLGGFILKDVSGYLIHLVGFLWLSDKNGETFENHLSSGKVHGVSTQIRFGRSAACRASAMQAYTANRSHMCSQKPCINQAPT